MKKPYLIQRGDIVRPLARASSTLFDAVDIDYMGSAEFEFGAQARSLRRIERNIASFAKRTTAVAGTQDLLRVWSYFSDPEWSEYAAHLERLRAGTYRLKERSEFSAQDEAFRRAIKSTLRTDFWWDIENDVMWTFDKTAGNRIGDWVRASLNLMNEDKP